MAKKQGQKLAHTYISAVWSTLGNILGEGGYGDPNNLHTVEMDTMLYVKDIIEIDGNRNDITVQLELWCYWTDPGLALTNESV